jgi:Flp pilus assembly pilin Flp
LGEFEMKLLKMLKRFVKDERGLEGSEYALLLALIAIAIVVAVTGLKDAIVAKFEEADTVISTGAPAS